MNKNTKLDADALAIKMGFRPRSNNQDQSIQTVSATAYERVLLLLELQSDRIMSLEDSLDEAMIDANRWRGFVKSGKEAIRHGRGKWAIRSFFTGYEFSVFDTLDEAIDEYMKENKQ